MHPEGPQPGDRRWQEVEDRLRDWFADQGAELERRAAEAMPEDLDALFEDQEPDRELEARLQLSFAADLAAEASSPARLSPERAAALDRRLAERLPRPTPVPAGTETPRTLRHPSFARRVGPWVAGLAAAGVLALLVLGQDRRTEPLFVLVDSDRPLTGQDPRLVSLWAAGAVPSLPGSLGEVPTSPVQGPKKGGE